MADKPHVRRLYKRFARTSLKGGASAEAVVVIPREGAYVEMASRINAALPAPLPVMEEDMVPRGGVWPWHVITLGNLMNNRVLGDLYLLERVCCDAKYPGGDGYVIRTVHNPWLNGRNVVELGGSGEAGVARAAQRLAEIVTESGPTLPPLLEVSARDAAQENRKDGDGALPDSAELSQIFRSIENHARALFRTGSKSAAQALRRAIPALLAGARNRAAEVAAGQGSPETMAWHNLPGTELCFASGVPMAWESVEDLELFSDEERLDMAEAIALLAGVSTFALTDFAPTPGYHGNLRCTLASFLLGLYVTRHCPELEVGPRILQRADRFYGADLRHWKPMEDATGYASTTMRETLEYVRLRPAWHWFERGLARRWAEYRMQILDNRGRIPGFGDSPGNCVLNDLVVPLCAWLLQDGRLAWAAERGGSTRDSFYAAVAPEPPADLVGVKVIPLDRWIYERPCRGAKTEDYTGLDVTIPLPESYETAKKAVPYERTFDKLTLRAGLEREDAYLLMSGFNYGHHSHLDANAICAFVDQGEPFLFDDGYMVPSLQEHCTLTILRDGVWRFPPEVSELAAVADFKRSAFVASQLHDCNGADWTRNIVWAKGRAFFVIDSVRARQAGTYAIQAVWRSRGEVRVEGHTMTAVQGSARFRLVSLSEAELTPRGCAYEFRGDPCGAAYESLQADMRPEDETCLENVFWTELRDSPVNREVRRQAPGAVVMRDDDGFAIAGLYALALDELKLEAAAFLISDASLSAAGARRLSLPGLAVEFEGDVSFEWDFDEGVFGLAARQDSAVAVSGPLAETCRLDGRLLAARAALAKGEHHLTLGAVPDWIRNVPGILDRAWERDRDRSTQAPRGAPCAGVREIARTGFAARPEALCCGDINGDGEDEAVVASLDGAVIAIDSRGRKLFALKLEGGCNDVAIADVDGDGCAEVLLAGRRSEIVCVAGDGSERWRHVTTADGTWYPNKPSPEILRLYPADIDHDGRAEIVAAVAGMKLLALSGEGEPRWTSRYKGRFTTDALVARLPGEEGTSFLIGNCYFSADRHDADGRILESVTMTWHGGPNRLRLGTVPGRGAVLALGDMMGRIRFVPWLAEERRFDNSEGSGPHYETGGTVTVLEMMAPAEGDPFWVAGGRSERSYCFAPDGALRWSRRLGDIPVQVRLVSNGRDRSAALCFVTENGQVQTLSLDGEPVDRQALPGPVALAALHRDGEGALRSALALEDGAVVLLEV